jgi:hypothetical protein
MRKIIKRQKNINTNIADSQVIDSLSEKDFRCSYIADSRIDSYWFNGSQ